MHAAYDALGKKEDIKDKTVSRLVGFYIRLAKRFPEPQDSFASAVLASSQEPGGTMSLIQRPPDQLEPGSDLRRRIRSSGACRDGKLVPNVLFLLASDALCDEDIVLWLDLGFFLGLDYDVRAGARF